MISKEVLMESLRQRETELYELQDEVERLREVIKNINGWVMCKDTDEIKLNCIRSQLECPSLKEVIE